MSLLIIGALVLCFSFVLLVGPPYLPTMDKQVEAALDLLALEKGQVLLELGCGDGKVLVAAARRGWQVTGIELNPVLVLLCWLRTVRYRRQVKLVWGNYWHTGLWPKADGIFGFVLPKFMTKLDETIIAWRKQTKITKSAKTAPLKLASFAFAIPNKTIDRQQAGVFLYIYK